MRIGLDFGGVIVKPHHSNDAEDTSLKGTGQIEVAHDGMLDGVRAMVTQTGGAVWIISKARPKMQEATRAWLNAVNFFSQTGMPPENLRFCLERSEKKGICEELAITHYVDDRIHIMQILRYSVPHLFMFGPNENRRFVPPWAAFATSWPELVGKVLVSSRWRYPRLYSICLPWEAHRSTLGKTNWPINCLVQ
jgi:hypothetical protein